MIDYYEILGVPPSASFAEIKVAFRHLAKEFHPDKTDGSKASVEYFLLLKNAYETLSTPVLKKKYLDARWQLKANGGKFEKPIYTPEHILKKAILFKQGFYYSDINRTNHFELKNGINDLLSDNNIHILNNNHDDIVTNAILQTLIPVIELLNYDDQNTYFHIIKKINIDQPTIIEIDQKIKQNKNAKQFQKLTPLFLLLALICLCLIIIWMIK